MCEYVSWKTLLKDCMRIYFNEYYEHYRRVTIDITGELRSMLQSIYVRCSRETGAIVSVDDYISADANCSLYKQTELEMRIK